MVQLAFQALFTVARCTLGYIKENFGTSVKDSRGKDDFCCNKGSKEAEFEDPCSFPPEPQMQQEPCVEPDSEPAPVEAEPKVLAPQLRCHSAEDPPPVEKSAWHWKTLLAAILALCLLALVATSSGSALAAPLSLPDEVPVAAAPTAVSAPLPVAEEMPATAPEAEAAVFAEESPGAQINQVEAASPDEAEAEAEAGEQAQDDEYESPSKHAQTITLTRHSFPVSSVGNIVYYRSAYYGTVHVGSPAVPFKVVFDTGSGHLILPSTYCSSETCRAHRRYRRSDSKSAKDIDYDGTQVMPGQPRDQITVSFGTGEVTGVFVEDTVCMNQPEEVFDNSSAGVASTAVATVGGAGSGELDKGCVKLRLIAATAMSEEPFKSFKFDGVLGLGLDGLSQAPEFNYLDILAGSFQNSASGGGKTPHTFAVFLAEDQDEESKITFGGWDEKNLQEDLSWNDVVDPDQGHWTIKIKAVRIGNEELNLCHEGCKGVVDTGTSLLAVPSMAFSELYTLLRHPAHMEGHCHGPGPLLNIELEHFTITLGPEDYARLERTPPRKKRPRFDSKPHDVAKDGRTDLHCKPMLMSMDLPAPLGPKLFILGEPVLRKFYSVYDAAKKRVGFGRARHQSKPSAPLRSDMTPALRKSTGVIERSASTRKSMFDHFRSRKLHRYGA